jgi:ATP-dependent Clp protease ATP-binding subunit ClpA
MSRLIQDTIRRALADELLFGKLSSGGDVEIDLDENDEIIIKILDEQSNQTVTA